MIYIKVFEHNQDYENYKNSNDYVTPNVSYVLEDNTIHSEPLDIRNFSVTMSSSGYKTFASEWAFVIPQGLRAFIISEINVEDDCVFQEVNDVIPPKTGVLLMGTPGQEYVLTSTLLPVPKIEGNKLFAVIRPTYVEADQYYGLSGNQFTKISAGTIPANKAIIPAEVVEAGLSLPE